MTAVHEAEITAGRVGAEPSAADWFHTRDLGAGVVLIAEPGHVNSFLVIGAERALLFDTGMGIASIGEAVAALTDLPVLAVNSHDHLDHRGGNADLVENAALVDLEDLCAHPAGRHDAVDPAYLAAYATAMGAVHADHETYRRLDASAFFAVGDLPRMHALPDLGGWQVGAVPPTRRLADGERIDLGGRTLRVLHTPGHSPDGLALWDEATGTLLAGDTVLAAAHWLHGEGADVAAFDGTLQRLAALRPARVLVAHNLRHELPGDAVERVAAAVRAVRSGSSVGRPGHDLLGGPACRHDVDGVVLLTPSEAS
ncbi:MBL fold metallo-hydrolase [Occultella kanbiaonis]|uniref:MBL fold metallo-hydrolase n=1 Tax=Occultella kanbiaonis TaxID=2675754 RepID=UPI0012B8B3DE|nr:MBL fold metallo-hydrolase [Occultella kanbiaonis]